jgi:hypothetical protein
MKKIIKTLCVLLLVYVNYTVYVPSTNLIISANAVQAGDQCCCIDKVCDCVSKIVKAPGCEFGEIGEVTLSVFSKPLLVSQWGSFFVGLRSVWVKGSVVFSDTLTIISPLERPPQV